MFPSLSPSLSLCLKKKKKRIGVLNPGIWYLRIVWDVDLDQDISSYPDLLFVTPMCSECPSFYQSPR